VRALPENKRVRRIVVLCAVLAAAAVLWFWVFPWIDRTYVNRPAVEEGLVVTRA
jgi:hypothetical protein